MAALGDWLVDMMKLAVMGVVVYSICMAIGNKTIANLVKLLAILLAVQMTFIAVARPIQSAHKKVTEIETKLQRSQNWLDKMFLFGGNPSKIKPDDQLLQGPKN